jgi:mono/diheme cytochrome c family protein
MKSALKQGLFFFFAVMLVPVFTLAADPGMMAKGKAIYKQECLSCHLESGKGAGNIPDIRGLSAQALVESKCGKVNKKPKEEIEALSAYLVSLK